MATPRGTTHDGMDPFAERTRPATGASPGQTLAERFLLREVIGHGATGTVFSALDRSVGQKVAIKLLHPDLDDATTRERLRREVRAARAGHPNLVTVYDLHHSDGRLFVSMELVDGTSLREVLQGHRPIDTERAASIGGQIASGLAHLHSHGIVHRDVKPGNILLTADGTAKLCDMGLARPIEPGTTLTLTEMVVGTPAYMAPEQGLGAELTAASDIYSLGVTLYQCLSGGVPLHSDNALATLGRRQRERPPTVRRGRPDCPRWFARLIRRMLEPRPEDRPTARSVERAFAARRMWPRPRRRTLATAAVGAALATAAVLATAWVLEAKTVRYEVEASAVHGVDAQGQRTWTHDLPGQPSTRPVEADLDGDGRPELVAVGTEEGARSPDSSARSPSHVIALTMEGSVVTRLVPEELIRKWGFPFRVNLEVIPVVLDLDGDTRDEVVLLCKHRYFYPTVVMIYWPRWDRWEQVLTHPGHLSAVTAGTVGGRPLLRFVGVNNLLAFTPVYGEIELVPPGDRNGSDVAASSLTAPPLGLLDTGALGAWRTYVPLDESWRSLFRDEDWITEHGDGSIHFGRRDVESFHLDRFANPSPGPNEGADLRSRRLAFMDGLMRLHRSSSPITPDGVRRLIEQLRSQGGPVLAERPYQIIQAVVGSRALATVGDLDGALRMVRDHAHLGDEDVLYLQGHLEAIAGDLKAARATTLRLIDTGASSRSHYDGLFLLLEIGAASRDRDLVAKVMERASRESLRSEHQRSLQSVFGARARLWWDESTPTDCDVRTGALAPEGDAIGCLIRWRRGRLLPGDPERMQRAIELNPEGAGLSWVALAAAHLGRAEPQQALTAVDAAIAGLEPTARFDFVDSQNLRLADALHALALEAAGEIPAAAAEAEAIAGSGPAELLPGILATEIRVRTGR